MQTINYKRVVAFVSGILFLVYPATSFGAVAFVNAIIEASRSSVAFDATGCDFLVLIAINNTTDTALSPTYNSVAMVRTFSYTVNNGAFVDFWVLKAPTTGSNTLALGATANSSAACYSGVKQSNTDDGHNSIQKAGSGNLTVSVTSATAGAWLIVTKFDQLTNPDSVVSGVMRGGSNFTQDEVLADSNGSVGAPGAHTIGFHYPSSDTGFLGAIAIAPPAAASTAPARDDSFFWLLLSMAERIHRSLAFIINTKFV